MKNIPVICIILLSAFVLLRCNKDVPDERIWPKVITLPVTDITELGARFNAEIVNRGDLKILSYGFVWSAENNPSLESSESKIVYGTPGDTGFSADVNTTLRTGVTFHVRAFIKTSEYTVYGKEEEFVSLGSRGPEIISFWPMKGSWGDTITIAGKGFSVIKENNSVSLGEIKASLISSNDSLILLTVPATGNSDSVKVTVSVLGNTTTASGYFKYLVPEITGISSLSGTFNDTIIINGRHFGRLKQYTSVFFTNFNSVEAEIVSCDESHIQVLVPVNLNQREHVISVITLAYKIEYKQHFVLDPPRIYSIEPDTVFHPDEILTIRGENFNPISQNNSVSVGGYSAQIIECSRDLLEVKLPAGVIENYRISVFKTVSAGMATANMSAGVPLEIIWHSTWTRKRDFPGQARCLGVAFSINNKGYYGTGIVGSDNYLFKDFWEYDPLTDQWARVADFPGSPRAASVGFTINGKGYVGTGTDKIAPSTENDNNHFRDFYEFDPVSGVWTRKADFQGVGRHSAACFVINDEGYIGTGHWGDDAPYGNLEAADDFWKYNPMTNTWSEAIRFPEPAEGAVGFEINGKGYVYNYNKLFEFDGMTWTRKTAPVMETTYNVAFQINNFGYFGLGTGFQGATDYFWQYYPVTSDAKNLFIGYNQGRYGSSAFVINGKAYIVCGRRLNESEFNEVWEFDPLKP